MRAAHLRKVRVLYEQVKRLRLVDKRAAVSSHINDGALLDLPHSFIELFNVRGDFGDILNRTICGYDLVFK